MPIVNNTIPEPVMEVPDGSVRTVSGEIISRDEAILSSEEDGYISEDDYSNEYFTCDGCSEVLRNTSYCCGGFCNSCEDEREVDDEYELSNPPRGNNIPRLEDIEVGEIVKSNRAFGIELEICEGNISELKDEISDIYTLTHDGSLSGNYAIEVISPILQGKKGEDSIIEAVKAINNSGFKTNNSCGFHVHLSADDYKCTSDLRIVNLYDLLKLNIEYPNPVEIAVISKRLYKQVVTRVNGSCQDFDNISEAKLVLDKFFECYGENSERTQNHDTSISETNLPSIGNTHKLDTRLCDLRTNENWTKKIAQSHLKDLPVSIFFSLPTKQELVYQNKLSANKALFDKINRLNAWGFSRSQLKKHGLTAEEMNSCNSGKLSPEYFLEEDDVIVVIKQHNYTNFERFKTVLATYHYFSSLFSSMLPESRRSRNKYCKPIHKELDLQRILGANTVTELEQIWYKERSKRQTDYRKSRHYDDSRYRSVNIHSLFEKGTIEIRQHSGTTNINKILNWVVIHQLVLDTISRNTNSIYRKVVDMVNIDSNTDIDFETLLATKVKMFSTMFNLDSSLIEYIKGRIKLFSGVDVDKTKRRKVKVFLTEDSY